MKKSDILIIGGGPAGLTAALYAARAGADVTLIEERICGGQITGTEEVENLPGVMSIGGPELAMNLLAQAENAGAKIEYATVRSVCFDVKKAKTDDDEYTAKAIILAMGAGPRRLETHGAERFDGRGIHYCGMCDGAFYKDRDVVVIGGGNSAVEEVTYLSPIVKSITVVNNLADFTAQTILVEKLLQLDNIKNIYHGNVVAKINGDDSLESIEIKDKGGKTKTIKCDGVFVTIGRAPNSHLVKGKIDLVGGYIPVDGKMQTAVPGIYAAGDIIEKQIRQIVTACSDGAVAASHAVHFIKSV